MQDHTSPHLRRMSIGVPGLDEVFAGGLAAGRMYLVEGDPGAGKTTLSLQFLLDGLKTGEQALYVTLSESREELVASAASHGWAIDNIVIRQYIAREDGLSADGQTTMFHPSEVELLDAMRKVIHDIEEVNPSRVVIDSLSEIRLLAQDPFRYRRQLLELKQLFLKRGCTVLLLDDRTVHERDRHVQSIVHGVLHLEQRQADYGAERRRLRLSKLRGTPFRGGWHDYVIDTGGLRVFPRLVAAEHRTRLARRPLSSGVQALDALLGGGTQSGTSMLILGPAGSGKTSLAVQFVVAAAKEGRKSSLFVFDESADFLMERTAAMDLPLREHVEAGLVTIRPIDPTELSPGQFANALSDAAERHHAELVVIDSLNGYLAAMPEEKHLQAQLHEMLAFLNHRGVATLLIVAQQGMLGAHMQTPVDASYLADTVVLLRFFEAGGRVKKAISVVKKRSGSHEDTIREMRLDSGGIHVGAALTNFRGVLTGTPVFEGATPARTDGMVADAASGPKGARA